ncbi:hypothetical protein BaRGS_00024661 [Batillaria attramentaria]|uniref:Nuclear receptor coactivator 6 TRADD-N domain-containing protein n=1 Tax=Batillaria attramentaria TaxID=370345 RepID=A0ABD0KAF7_9CAEN
MGPQEDYIETVVTCEGDFHDPQLPRRLECFRQQLKDLLLADTHKPLILKKVEPWNSVRVTFNIPREAALRLKQLAEQGSASLRRLGVLAVQIDGDRLVSLTLATPNNQHAELIIRTHDASAQATTAGPSQASATVGAAAFDTGLPSSSDELGSPGPSSMEVTRKNIEEYLRQGSLFNSILAPSTGAGPGGGPDMNGPGSDVFKTPSCDSGPFRLNSVGSEILAGPSGVANFQQRSQFTPGGSLVSGVGAGAYSSAFSAGTPGPGGRGSRLAAPGQQSLATALPQTAAVGFNMHGLPPPPPYPHGHAAGVVNNVGRQGKKVTASSPLLVNLLQTEPLAGGAGLNSKNLDPNEPPKPRKRRRKKKDKQVTATSVGEGEQSALGSLLPMNPGGPFSSVLNDTGPLPEDMNTLVNRPTSPPLPLPSPRLSIGSTSVAAPVVDRGVGDDRRVRSPPSASAALAAMAESQRMSDADSSDAIINPYTGQLEPRDSLTDLSPGKKDPHKTRKSPSISDNLVMSDIACGFSSTSNVVPSVAAALDSVIERAAAADPLRLDTVLPSVPAGSAGRNERHTATSVLSSAREGQERNSAVTSVTASLAPPRAHGLASDSLIGRLQELVSQSAPVVSSATPIYAQHPSITTQSASRTPALSLSDSTANGHRQTPPGVVPASPAALIRSQLTVNGPITSHTSPKTVSAGTGTTMGQDVSSPQRTGAVPAVYSGNPHTMPLHVQSSVRPTPHRPHSVHNVHNAGGSDGTVSATSVQEQHPPVTRSESTLHRPPVSATDRGPTPSQEVTTSTSVPIPTTSATITSSDTLNLLNSSPARLSSALGAVAQHSTDTTSINTASPVGSKALSEGDDNSNHSGIGPDGIADGTAATVTLLDGSSTKTYNHDSGLGSASERSDDTPSEPGDGEYHTNATETPGSMESNTITVGYVHVNEHSAHIYNKEIKEQPVLKDIAHLSAQQDTSSLATGVKMLSEDPMHSMSHLVKSSTMAMLTGKESSAALPLSRAVSTVATVSASQQPQQSTASKSKGIANCQVTAVHQNGPVRSYSPNQPTALTAPHGPAKASSPGQPPHRDPLVAPHSHSQVLTHSNSLVVNSHGDGGAPSAAAVVSLPGVSASPAIVTSVTHAAAACVTTASAVAKYSHGDSVAHNSAPLSSAAAERQNKPEHDHNASLTTTATSEKGVLSNAVKQRMARLSTSAAASSSAEAAKPSGLDPGSMPPELIAASARDASDMDILEATQHLYHAHENVSNDTPHSPVFENDDLVLGGERGLTGFLEADVRHSATNGGGVGGVSTDARAGSNITSIYSKRSSPVNVNMLNHIYAPGLPLPRRLTESVQRLVKPLPATENSLPQARACKSPGTSSSRHNSNGASSPGRASQGGARSPGVSTAVTVSRMLSYDKTAMSQAGFVINSSTAASSVGGPVGYLPSSHPAHTMQDVCSSASVTCCANSTLSSTPHVLSNVQPTSHMVTAPYTLSSSYPVSAPHHPAAASMYNQPVSSFVSAPCYSSPVPRPELHTTVGGAVHFPTASTFAATTHLLTSTHQSVVASSSSLISSAAASSLSHDTLPPRLQHPPRSHSMQGVQNPHSTSSTVSTAHVSSIPVSLQLPRSSAVGSVSSSVSSSLAVSAGHEGVSGAGHSLPPVLRLPGHVPRPSPGQHVTVCNNLPMRHSADSGLPPRLTVTAAPVSLAAVSTHSTSVSCAASSLHTSSSPSCVIATSSSAPSLASNVAAVSCPPTSAVKPHTEPGPVASTVTVTHQKVASLPAEPSSGVVLGHVAGTVSSAKTSESEHVSVVTSKSVARDIAPQAATMTVVESSSGSRESSEVGETGVKGQTAEPDDSLGKVVSRTVTTHHNKPEGPESAVPATTAAVSVTRPTPPAACSGTNKELGDEPVQVENGVDSLAKGSVLTVASKQSSAASATETESAVGQAGETGGRNSDVGGSPSVVHEAEVSSEGMQSVQPTSSEKPPQLQPPPPPLIPTVVPSATPPPPPLTPVPQELTKREHPPQAATASHSAEPAHTDRVNPDRTEMPSASSTATTVSSSRTDLPSETVSTAVSTAAEPAASVVKNSSSQPTAEDSSAVDSKQANDEDGKSAAKTQKMGSDSANLDAAPSEVSAPSAPKPSSSQPVSQSMPELSSEDSTRSRRITRKRKSTQSESDSSEPPQKISTESGSGVGNSRDKSSDRDGGRAATSTTASDQPPKLQREGKRTTSATEETEKDKEKGGSKDSSHHHERNIIEATPEEIAKKQAAASGKRRTYYVYVPEKSLTYFDTPVLQGRTRSQSSHTTTKDGAVTTPPNAAPAAAAAANATSSASGSQLTPSSGQPTSQPASGQKEEGNEASTSGSKRSTRLRTKGRHLLKFETEQEKEQLLQSYNADSSSSKRKRGKEHR